MEILAPRPATYSGVTELARVISSRVQLRRVGGGSEWLGLCPFHEERTPSFSVFRGRDGKGRYHCFGCGARGDLVDWLRVMEGKSYREVMGDRDDEITRGLLARREYDARRSRALGAYRDRQPDSCLPDWAIRTD